MVELRLKLAQPRDGIPRHYRSVRPISRVSTSPAPSYTMANSTLTELQRYSQALSAHTLLQLSAVFSDQNQNNPGSTDKKPQTEHNHDGSNPQHRTQSYRHLFD